MSIIGRLGSEISYLRGALRTLNRVTPIAKNKTRTFPDVLNDLAAKHAGNPALMGQGQRLSFEQLNLRANQYARWAREAGLRKGDTVALMMGNCPEYLAVWMGIARAGGVTALLNTNLTGHSLGHCINIVPARNVIFHRSFLPAWGSAVPHLSGEHRLWLTGGSGAVSGAGPDPEGALDLDAALAATPNHAPADADVPTLTTDDAALYIYTSGTTGLPKAAVINHYRVQAIMNGFSAVCNAQADDRIYVAQPLYHTAGGVLAIGITLTVGGSVAIRDRFSASKFWDDIVEYDCTAFQYIGELCRYLLNAPHTPNETKHKLRFCNGNGLRPDIWMDFKERFQIPRIVEWYAATEGNVTLFNMDGKPGSVGRIPAWLKHRFPTKIVRFDVNTEQPVRDQNGRVIECAPDEVGEAIGQILIDPSKPAQRFDGYADKEATERKILRDAFEDGDSWFRTGDLMRKDALGYFYFIDRIGDTFRWKGENVSTNEVEEAISGFPGLREVNVYGVEVPGHNGRAGMAALVSDGTLDLRALQDHIDAELPAYARPLFLRLRSEIELTGTFKIKKVDLRKEGFDPAGIDDALYLRSPETGNFEPMSPVLFEAVQGGGLRL
jgi:fatty-acyl-CoA synthase